MDYKAELDEIGRDVARLTASRNELRTTMARIVEEGFAVDFRKLKKPTPEKIEEAKRYSNWKLQMLRGKYHVIAKLVLAGSESVLNEYKALLKGAMSAESPKVLKNIAKSLKEKYEIAQRIIAEEIALLET